MTRDEKIRRGLEVAVRVARRTAKRLGIPDRDELISDAYIFLDGLARRYGTPDNPVPEKFPRWEEFVACRITMDLLGAHRRRRGQAAFHSSHYREVWLHRPRPENPALAAAAAELVPCPECERLLPPRNFSPNPTKANGRASWCKACAARGRRVARSSQEARTRDAEYRRRPEVAAARRERDKARRRKYERNTPERKLKHSLAQTRYELSSTTDPAALGRLRRRYDRLKAEYEKLIGAPLPTPDDARKVMMGASGARSIIRKVAAAKPENARDRLRELRLTADSEQQEYKKLKGRLL